MPYSVTFLEEKLRKEAGGKIAENIFKFIALAVLAIIIWVVGNYLYGAPWRPSYFGGRLSEFLYLILFAVVSAFMIFAVSKIKAIVDVLSELISLEITRYQKETLYYAERIDNAIKPFLYLSMRTAVFVLFSPILDWISPTLTVIIGIVIIIWSIIAVYQSLSALARSKGTTGAPIDFLDFLTFHIEKVSISTPTERQLDFAYNKAREANEELNKIRRWKYSFLALFVISAAASYYLMSTGLLSTFLGYLGEYRGLSALFGGFMFASIITVPLSIATIITLVKTVDPLTLALVGGLGAMIMDLIMFKASIHTINEIEKKLKSYKITVPKINPKIANVLVPIVAGFIILSPFPDEIAVALLGSIKYNLKHFVIISYLFNAIGIFLVATAVSVL